jgi:glutathione synthase/RimK-type ligase-like ATP-grasp enzyme
MRVVLSELPPSAFPEPVAGCVWLPRLYINRPERFRGRGVRVVNLSRDCVYLGTGYYASLLAEARGHKVLPTVRTILDFDRKSLYRLVLPELNALLARPPAPPLEPQSLLVAFGRTADPQLRELARDVFDRLRHPLLRLQVRRGPEGAAVIGSVRALAPAELSAEEFAWFAGVLGAWLRVPWRAEAARPQPRYSIALLHNPQEPLPPSRPEAIRKFVRVGAAMGIEVEPIRKRDFLRLTEFDGLLIRETTSLTDHTYRFARKAEREGLAVIDDPTSIVRCTNKVYLAELLRAHGLPTPRTVILDRRHLRGAAAALGFPMVLKVPDGSFSRGVIKVPDAAELRAVAARLLEESDLILAQEFVPTRFDWRVGVLGGEPLYVCQYFMSKNHWQILKHEADGRTVEGTFRTFAVEQAPPEVVELGRRAASLIGDGLYGVDIKETGSGLVVIEVNDNPNLDAGVEDAVLKDELYRRVLAALVQRIGRRLGPAEPPRPREPAARR